MSKVDELIEQLCPEGVERKTLGELGKFYGGLTGKSKDDFTDGNAKFVTYKNVYSNPALNLHPEETVKIAEGEKQRTLKYGDIIFTGSSETPDECGFASVVTEEPDEDLYLNSFCFFLRMDDTSILNPDFAKHLFRSRDLRVQIGKTASGVTRFNVSKKLMEKVTIPIPPLPVQEEIVRILDNFTDLTAELQAELQARAKQYEYYTQTLLNKPIGNIYKLGEIATIKTGRKPDKIYEELGQYEYINAGTSNSGYVNAYNCEGDTTTTPSRGQGGIGFVGYQSRDFWLGPLCYRIKSKNTDNVLNKYIYYYLKCFPEKILQYKKEGGTPSINASDLINIDIIVPSREEQEKIVTILNSFESLTTNISEGLPAEIEARQKQYEYYRNKLLTFKELGA